MTDDTQARDATPDPGQTLAFKISGMDCAEEVAALKRAVGPAVGGDDRLNFDLLRGRMLVTAAPGTIDSDAVLRAVRQTGMDAEPWREEGPPHSTGVLGWRSSRFRATAASGTFLVMGFATHAVVAGGVRMALGSEGVGVAHAVPIGARIFYALAIVSGSWFVAPKAWFALRSWRPDMNLLMTIAVAGAVGIGEWFEAATVAFLFALSLALEAWSVGRARRAIEALLDLSAPVVHLTSAVGRRDVPPEEVPIGARFLVKPGEKIPLDGRVVQGTSDVNQAPITGESVPLSKGPGADVFAGSINGDGALEVEATKLASDTTLAHIIRLVEQAQRRRAPSERWVERFARIYTPAVLGLAAAVLLLGPILFPAPWQDWVYPALVLLVIGCPCALVISTPVTIVAALAAAARHGVLIKGGEHVEAPAHLRAIALDKTGTLTVGAPRVVEVRPLNGHSERELIARAAALESHSEHPLARAVLAHATAVGVTPWAVEQFQVVKGKGAHGLVGGKPYWIGSHRYLEERGQETPAVHLALEGMARDGRSVIVVGNDAHVCGLLAVADATRPDAAAAVEDLKRAGVERIVMLTGDNRETAEAIARQTGIDQVRAELLPADKVEIVEGLVASHGHVAMVGDGVNDAPAMAAATVGIAMGAIGTDAAIETADIALMTDDLSRLAWLVRHSRRALATIRQNVTASLAVKAVFVGLTVAGTASLWAAIAADMGVSLLVIANALRLLRPERRWELDWVLVVLLLVTAVILLALTQELWLPHDPHWP